VAELPLDAVCRSCGYALRGLPGLICPECGKAFDPSNPKSFATSAARLRRRRRRVRAAWILAGAGLTLWLAPRTWWSGTMTFVCQDCGHSTVCKRSQLLAPPFAPVEYPWLGHGSRQDLPAASQPVTPCPHRYAVSLSAYGTTLTWKGIDFAGRIRGSCAPDAGQVGQMNGLRARPENAQAILQSVVIPVGGSFGISVGEVDDPDAPPAGGDGRGANEP
jgi:predicted RNA-binding Zn-ribbon protein involved in translation (DUF1610 family)